MKSTNYQQLARITDPETLQQAWRRIHAKKAAGGVDGQTVADFSQDELTELDRLREELLTGAYIPQPLLQVAIPKHNQPNEKRVLGLPAVRDKVAQEAVRRVIEPLINRHFVDNSYGYRPGKGPQKAIKRVCHILQTKRPAWVAALDIDDFFPSIDHDLLMDQFRSYQIEEPVCRLLLLWLKMGVVNSGGRWLDVYHGVSQGGIVSPLLANVYLHPLDQYLKDKAIEFVRYADDIRLFLGGRREAEDLLARVSQFLHTELKLRLNSLAQPVTAIHAGFVFLGIRFAGDQLLIDPEKWSTIRHKMHNLLQRLSKGPDAEVVRQVNESIAGWKHYYGSLVEPQEMAVLGQELKTVLIQKLAHGCQTLSADNFTELPGSLQFLEIPGCNTGAERQQFLQEVMAQARQEARKQAERRQTEKNVKKTVRQAKRRQGRQLFHVSHLMINTPGLFLGKQGNRVVVRQQRQTLYEVPFNCLESITLLCRSNSLSSDLITHCAAQGVPICWISGKGEVEAFIHSPASPAQALQLRQLEMAHNPEQTFKIARGLVLGKIKNQINLIKYFGKYEKRHNGAFNGSYGRFISAASKLVSEINHLRPQADWPQVRGHLFSLEGRLASHYWDMVKLLLAGIIDFPGREQQGATDLVNSFLNYGYAVLRSRVLLALYQAGLNPFISFLHIPRRNEATLAFDMMEVFRPQVVDRVVIAELRRRKEAFKVDQTGRLTEETRKVLVGQIEGRLATIQPFRGQELKLSEIIQVQVKDLRQHIEGQSEFRPYIGKW